MNCNEKGRAGWHQAIPTTPNCTSKSTGIAARIKSMIVALALRGLLPYRVAEWLIQYGGLRNV